MTFPSSVIYELYMEGKHPDNIAKILKLSSKQVYRVCARKYAHEGGWVKGFPSSLERVSIRDEFLHGRTLSELSMHYNRPMWTIHKVVRNLPKGIASLPDAPKASPSDMMITPIFPPQPEKPTWGERVNRFFRRVFSG